LAPLPYVHDVTAVLRAAGTLGALVLLRFEVANHRSILEPIELSMIAVDDERPAARTFPMLNERVLTVAGIYGANASGKTNVLDALAWLARAVASSLRVWGESVPRDAFKFGKGPESPSTYEVDMMVVGVRYVYRLEVSDTEVLFEGLYSYPARRRRSLLERDGMRVHLRRGLSAPSGGIRELLTPTTLALSAALRLNAPEMQEFGRQLAGMGVQGLRRRAALRRGGGIYVGSGPAYGRSLTDRIFLDALEQPGVGSDEGEKRLGGPEPALGLLRFADLGIDGVQVVREPAGDLDAQDSRRYLRLLHRADDEQLPFDFAEESEGTQTWFRLIGPTLRALRRGQMLVLDEIDASLHPRLSARLVELFQDPETNPLGAQLIFTTHDTSLLNHLNRDEVWLTEKGPDGATTLTALAEFGGDKVRRSLNLEKAYLQGRFGAVPEFDQHQLRRALGGRDEEQ
jgi:hypothetical protein